MRNELIASGRRRALTKRRRRGSRESKNVLPPKKQGSALSKQREMSIGRRRVPSLRRSTSPRKSSRTARRDRKVRKSSGEKTRLMTGLSMTMSLMLRPDPLSKEGRRRNRGMKTKKRQRRRALIPSTRAERSSTTTPLPMRTSTLKLTFSSKRCSRRATTMTPVRRNPNETIWRARVTRTHPLLSQIKQLCWIVPPKTIIILPRKRKILAAPHWILTRTER